MGSKEEENVPTTVRSIVYIFKQGGPTLVGMVTMGLLCWQTNCEVVKAVNTLTIAVESNNKTMLEFMRGVTAAHELQNKKLDAVLRANGKDVSTSW